MYSNELGEPTEELAVRKAGAEVFVKIISPLSQEIASGLDIRVVDNIPAVGKRLEPRIHVSEKHIWTNLI